MNHPIKSILVIYETDSNTTGFSYTRTRDGANCEGYINGPKSSISKAFHYNNGWRSDYFSTVIQFGARKFSQMKLPYVESNPDRIREFVLNSADFVNDKILV